MKIAKYLALLITLTVVLRAQPAFPNSPNQAPIGGLGLLAAAGGAMALKKFYDKKNKYVFLKYAWINYFQIPAGFKSVVWDGTNDLGQPVSAGMYLYRISAGNFHSVKKMVLLK